ncbi:SWIM zinc finger family protein [Allostreptomyces psammosilenae]|uniref:Putative Zn finger protein n=1 Tax=Allostreptomyces psammosilenae TaxID=1892865 RepID=A0A852ZV38_9ACTN|nr:SWIM zinc finger family protein [Allostreptomyces psammosilenae]NYI05477.1 putative Zn finger protein [Allostreptomyces psammosilenae]
MNARGGGGDRTGRRRGRDGAEEARGFPAFPPQRRGRRFARTWWGDAWIRAMEETSLDAERLARGRRYAKAGHVGTITISPGRIAAPVHGSGDEPYQTVVFVERLTEAEWGRLLDQVASEAGHIAALLDRDMPRDLVEAAEDAGVRLLPDVGDLEPECDCPDWGYPCKHAAALSYQVSWLLDEDPFLLLLMRGKGEAELLDELQQRNARQAALEAPAGPAAPTAAPTGATGSTAAGTATPVGATPVGATSGGAAPCGATAPHPEGLTWDEAASAQPAPTGVPAHLAYGRPVPPLPEPPPLPDPDPGTAPTAPGGAAAHAPHATSSPLLDVAPVPGAPAPEALALLVADAAVRARALLTAPEPPEELDVWQDTVRFAATHPDASLLTRLAGAAGVRPPALERAAAAWRQGGPAGLDALERAWSPPRPEFARARAALSGAWAGEEEALPELGVWRNRWTVAERGVQLRLGRDGRWYPYRARTAGDWWPAGPPERDPAVALADLLA